jgi:hypothetical protein
MFTSGSYIHIKQLYSHQAVISIKQLYSHQAVISIKQLCSHQAVMFTSSSYIHIKQLCSHQAVMFTHTCILLNVDDGILILPSSSEPDAALMQFSNRERTLIYDNFAFLSDLELGEFIVTDEN